MPESSLARRDKENPPASGELSFKTVAFLSADGSHENSIRAINKDKKRFMAGSLIYQN
jgi:hypothetical protein